MTPEETVKPKRTRKPKEQANYSCHIHDNCETHDRKSIHKYVCRDLETAKHTDSSYYCLLHRPTREKNFAEFENIFIERLHENDEDIAEIEAEFPDDINRQIEVSRERLIRYDFRCVWFPSVVDLSYFNFKAFTDFSFATFSSYASFRSAMFNDSTSFVSTTFVSSADFISAIFNSSTDFSFATFAEKSEIFFNETTFNSAVHFNHTKFDGNTAFEGNSDNRVFVGDDVVLDLQNARIDDAKKISFHTVRLEPSWFVNQKDVAEFVFTDCKWRYADGTRLKVKTEIENLKQRKVSDNPHEILTKACWQLADNHEKSNSLSKASMFRKFASESKRLATPWYLQPFTLHWWYYAVSYYGESWRRALIVLILVLGGFGLFFESPFASFELTEKKKTEIIATQATDKPEQPQVYKMNYGEGFTYSLSVATFQRPEPKAYDTLTKLFVVLEVIFAPLQAALLALAIRRKFMR